MSSFQFGSPIYFLFFIPLLGLIIWRLLGRGTGVAVMRYSSLQLVQGTAVSWRVRLYPMLQIMRWILLGLLILVLARPQRVDSQEIVKGEGIDIALVLDISGSMASLDFEPKNRLETAKDEMEQFVAKRPYDRIGLTVFANDAFSQSPLTIDHNVLGRLLGEIKLASELGITDGTAIGMGLANGINMLKDSNAESKIVILLTDGVNNSGQIDPETAAEIAKALGIKLYTIGMGRPGQVPMPQSTIFGRQVVMVESVLDEESLKEIASLTGGRFYRAVDTEGLAEIYEEIDLLERSEIEIRTFKRYEELWSPLLLGALCLFLLEMLLRFTIFRRLP